MFGQFGQNAGYVEELYRLFLADPSLVGDTWAAYFSQLNGASAQLTSSSAGSPVLSSNSAAIASATGSSVAEPSVVKVSAAKIRDHGQRDLDSMLALQERATRLVAAYRERGHLRAKVNPLTKGVVALPGSADLDPAFLGIGESEHSQEVQCAGFKGRHLMPLGQLLEQLQAVYCDSVGFEYGHVPSLQEREWLQQRAEKDFPRRDWFTAEERKQFFRKLHEADAMEAELHKRYVGAKRFSLQGGDTLIPMLEVLIQDAAKSGISDVVIGMAHRGRLNVLANIADKPLQQIFAEFEDTSMATVIGAGDVKYHQGICSTLTTASGDIRITLAPNPSHLEFVNPVVSGMTRALQDRDLGRDRKRAVGLLIHGDAAFIGQGVVPESLNFSNSAAYSTAGTVHLVINNQVGFTTDAAEARSSVYCTDVAKINGAPILHVNSEDIDACCWATRLALEYRSTFARDIVIDLYCYRKYGHNEGDDPTFTQPLMYSEVKLKKPLSELYAAKLLSDGVLSSEEKQGIEQEYHAQFKAAAEALKFSVNVGDACPLYGKLAPLKFETSAPLASLEAVAESLVSFPEGFTPHPKLKAIIEKRVHTLKEESGIDWGFAETLAFGTLLMDETPVRLTGQDAGRGTFSHRHLELHDTETPNRFYPLQTLSEKRGLDARFEVYNSVLSEAAVMGFEFGYSATHAKALVLWEAQFGDFANGAQVIIDQFLAASEVKWGQRSGLVLLLPHGYEGQGPEHSSARLERFLQLCAEGNMTVVNLTTPAQYFHLLRKQGLSDIKRPVVVMTPKSLLRSPEAVSGHADLTSGSFKPVISEDVGEVGSSASVVFVSGKAFYDARSALLKANKSGVRLVRVEQLYPFPAEEVKAAVKGLSLRRAAWIQEEPKNMGAWNFVRERISEAIGSQVTYVGRPESASTACGSARWHSVELKRMLEDLLAAVE